MSNIQNYLKKENEELERIVKTTKKRLENMPEGHLRISKNKRGIDYYYKNKNIDVNEKKSMNGKYIRKSQIEFVKKLAQKDFDICLVKTAQERIDLINKFLAGYEKTDLKKMYENINFYRKTNY